MDKSEYKLPVTKKERAAILKHCSKTLPAGLVQKILAAKDEIVLKAEEYMDFAGTLEMASMKSNDGDLESVLDKLYLDGPDDEIFGAMEELMESDPEKFYNAMSAVMGDGSQFDWDSDSEDDGLSPDDIERLDLSHYDCAVSIDGELEWEDVKDAPIYKNAVSLAKFLENGKTATFANLSDFARKNWIIADTHIPQAQQFNKETAKELMPMLVKLYFMAGMVAEVSEGKYVGTDLLANINDKDKAGPLYILLTKLYLCDMRSDNETIDELLDSSGYTLYQLDLLSEYTDDAIILDKDFDRLIAPSISPKDICKRLGIPVKDFREAAYKFIFMPLQYAGLITITGIVEKYSGQGVTLVFVKDRFFEAVNFDVY